MDSVVILSASSVAGGNECVIRHDGSLWGIKVPTVTNNKFADELQSAEFNIKTLFSSEREFCDYLVDNYKTLSGDNNNKKGKVVCWH